MSKSVYRRVRLMVELCLVSQLDDNVACFVLRI